MSWGLVHTLAMPEPANRRIKEEELSAILWAIWMEWSDTHDPSQLSENKLRQLLKERGVHVLDETWRGGYRALLEQFKAQERSRHAAMMFLLFMDYWSTSLSSRWMHRIRDYQDDQASPNPRLPAWRHVRGAGERVIYDVDIGPEGRLASGVLSPAKQPFPGATRDEDGKYWFDSHRDPADRRKIIGAKPLVYPHDADSEAITTITTANTRGEIFGADEVQRQGGSNMIPTWQTEEDTRVCSICDPLNHQLPRIWRRTAPNGPPAHQRCRCHLRWRYLWGRPGE